MPVNADLYAVRTGDGIEGAAPRCAERETESICASGYYTLLKYPVPELRPTLFLRARGAGMADFTTANI